jgi:small GTP-binding protein
MNKLPLSAALRSTLALIEDDNKTPVAAEKPQRPLENIKLVLVGDANVGKTELAYCFKHRVFSGTTSSTIGVDYTSVDMLLCKEQIHTRIELFDTAGQERFGNHLTRNYYRLSDGVIIVFDPQNDDSVHRAHLLHKQITADVPDIVCMFVANKLDLFPTAHERRARIVKLANLFTPPKGSPPIRPTPEIYMPEELEMPFRAISLRENPAAAVDLVAEIGQRIIMNRAAAEIRCASNPLSPRSTITLGSSKSIARQQRDQLQRTPRGAQRQKRFEESDTDQPKKKNSCFF